MKKVLMAIDPGKEGFLTLFSENQFYFYPMPEKKVESGKFNKNGSPKMETVFDEMGFRELVLGIARDFPKSDFHCIIEEVSGRNGWSAGNSFNFGLVAGMQRMIPIMLGAKITLVRPQKWQAQMYNSLEKVMVKSSTGKTMVHDTKATSKLVAQKIAPEIDFRKNTEGRGKKLDDNKTDSFLMLCYLKNHVLKM